MTSLLDEMVEARLAWVSARLRSWYAAPGLRLQLGTALAPEADRVANAVFGQELRDAVSVVGVEDPLAWSNQRLELRGGGWALTGIRYRGLEVTHPFVDVVATTAAPTPDGLARVSEAVEAAYAGFDPLCHRVDAPYPDALVAQLLGDQRFGAGCGVDQHVVAGPVSRLRDRARTPSAVRLAPGEPDRLAARAAEVYAQLVEGQPELREWAVPEDADSLRECAEEGLLFEVLVGGQPAGVTAAIRRDDHGLRGFCMQELCLDAAHRGRRLGPAIVEQLLDRLPATPGDVLWGTIHPANAPSLRNALSLGRELVGGYVWVAPAGSPGMPTSPAS